MPRLERLLPLVCILTGLLLIGSELLNTFEIENTDGQVVALVDAGQRHLYALGLLGLLGIVATLAAVYAGSRPAALVVVVAGLGALLLFGLIDLPDSGASDLIADANNDLTQGEAVAAGGFWVSLIAATLMTLGGAMLAMLSPEQLRALRRRR